ncbi:MAG: hypothetical protein NXI32_24415, partial [bacterium]|nr:hypothetical protein [bacterium]
RRSPDAEHGLSSESRKLSQGLLEPTPIWAEEFPPIAGANGFEFWRGRQYEPNGSGRQDGSQSVVMRFDSREQLPCSRQHRH